MQHGKLRTNRGPGFVDDVLFVKLVRFNISNIITAGKYRLNTNSSINCMWQCRRASTEQPFVHPNQNPNTKIKMWITRRYGATCHFPKYLNGCKNSERILWMKQSLSIETHTRALLMKPLQIRRDEWYRANTVFLPTSRKTDITRFARGPKWQGPLVGNAQVKPYLEQKFLVTW